MNDTQKNHRLFDISYVWEIVKMLPLLAAAAYLIGYVVNQSYLTSLGIPYVRFINSVFFKSGILVLAVFLPVIYTVYIAFDEPTDNLRKASRYIPIVTNHSVSIIVILTWLVTCGIPNDFTCFKKELPFSNLLFILIIIDLGLWNYATSYAGRRMSFRIKSLVLILMAAAVYICAMLVFPVASRSLLILLGITSVITFLVLGLYGDRMLTTVGPLVFIILFFFCCSIFGRHVYPAIPQYFGGTRPYVATLTVKAEYATAMAQMGFVLTQSSQIEKATIVYDDADTYVLTNDRGSHAVSKQVFVAISSSK
ncbi:MAG TPA: hypothetical protein ACFYD7_07980 [Candidatus Wujingus californicus]|uniref:hypothetical protein n=1 Tax=Candidatus Wujingus californicus TaxID=3367618 RepID=UPI001DD22CA4|nr:hypothetical protein [Planctomycetota bacterium]MDO8132373.1 hypothetical protein [Candidatus Brocadiales bacterium]